MLLAVRAKQLTEAARLLDVLVRGNATVRAAECIVVGSTLRVCAPYSVRPYNMPRRMQRTTPNMAHLMQRARCSDCSG